MKQTKDILLYVITGIIAILALLLSIFVFNNNGIAAISGIVIVVNFTAAFFTYRTKQKLSVFTNTMNDANKSVLCTKHSRLKGNFLIKKLNGVNVSFDAAYLPAGKYTVDVEYDLSNAFKNVEIELYPHQTLVLKLVGFNVVGNPNKDAYIDIKYMPMDSVKE